MGDGIRITIFSVRQQGQDGVAKAQAFVDRSLRHAPGIVPIAGVEVPESAPRQGVRQQRVDRQRTVDTGNSLAAITGIDLYQA